MSTVHHRTPPNSSIAWRRLPVLALALGLLLFGLWAGLLRMGWPWPLLLATLPMAHGPLMINGFLGTLIGLERAVALGRWWAYSAPLLMAGGVVLVMSGGGAWGIALLLGGNLAFLAVMAWIIAIHPTVDGGVIALGVGLLLVGNGLWLAGWPINQLVFWWAGFLILTIAGERLELSRLLRLSQGVVLRLLAGVGLYLAGLLVGLYRAPVGVQISGVAMLAIAAWLLRYDIASRRIKSGGQARFVALALLSGYLWLWGSGLLALRYANYGAGPYYDALLHTLFLGFVFPMIFGHALIVFPAVLQRRLTYTPWFYSHLILLHLSLLVRISGDLLLWWPGRQWGGLLNGVVLILFLVNTVSALRGNAAAIAGHPHPEIPVGRRSMV